MFVRNPIDENYSLTARPGWLRLTGSAVTLNDVDSPTFSGRRQTDLSCRASTRLLFDPRAPNEEAGLVLRGNDRNHCEIVATLRDGKRKVGLRKVFNGETVEPVTFHDAPAGELILSVRAAPLSYEFFCQMADGRQIHLGTARTRDLSTETLTAQKNANFNFTGVVIGLFATGNGAPCKVPADFDWFEYERE
jgi:alpha-N-arabinofuranosidase